MGRSQRHKLSQQQTTSLGEVRAQGVIAPGILRQGATPVVPVGESGGPLKGSSLTGAVPVGYVPTLAADGNGTMETPSPSEEPNRERVLPSGPLTISRIDDHPDGIAILVVGGDLKVGDEVVVEATGNTSVNGTFKVLAIEAGMVIVDSNYELAAPIEARGRLTIASRS